MRYLDHDFQVLSPGNHVICALTGKIIMLDELRYWNVDRQEAYYDASASLAREMEANPALRARS